MKSPAWQNLLIAAAFGSCILGGEQASMKLRPYARVFLNVASYLLVCGLVNDHSSFVVRGFGKLLVFLVFASLLMFVVVHSAEIRRVAVAFFEALRLPLFSLVVDSGSVERPPTDMAVPNKPFLPSLFQRPPPIFSF